MFLFSAIKSKEKINIMNDEKTKKTVMADRICVAVKGERGKVIVNGQLLLTSPVVDTWRSVMHDTVSVETKNTIYICKKTA